MVGGSISGSVAMNTPYELHRLRLLLLLRTHHHKNNNEMPKEPTWMGQRPSQASDGGDGHGRAKLAED